MIKPNDFIEQLNKIVMKYSTEKVMIMAVPGQIRNNGRLVDAIMVVIGNNEKKTKEEYIYRGLWTNFESFIKKHTDKINNE